jgi:hypothetical protein
MHRIKNAYSLCIGIFFFAVLGFELRIPFLVDRHSTTSVTPPVLFCDGFFWDRVL